ncbi:MAG TPA: preprotein translocase subunit SecA [Thermoanaerobaculia bacterium]|nr:preprotein translocase subunit SecA [Thermoanaerobaculia bacterium]HUM28686.1 preprotein translocase subunit SecA [Thermoanaerobaculia bacterium]HXK66706.1 preprotein translocase subunit SecA [Thermoanaerobaculia bacterium]
MINKLLVKIIGTENERVLKRILPLVSAVNDVEGRFKPLSNDQLRAMTGEFRQKLDQGATTDDILVDAFAVVREAARRSLHMRHFDVQVIGAKVLYDGKIAEMRTGEGKTLVATMPAYLRALEGRGVHVVTVNDYLARRDTEWMGQIYRFLGLSVGTIQAGLTDSQRQEAYGADITYGTNNEFGFDYLRDNMKFSIESMVQRPHYYAIVDEVDSILIDEARTPLIISGPSEESTEIYYRVNRIIPKLVRGEEIAERQGEKRVTGDFIVDEKARSVTLTEEGVAKVENLLRVRNLYDPSNMDLLHAAQQGLKAHALFNRDVDYIVKDGEVIIVDEFTGRLMPGRRWSDGLHQAVEAKEGVKIERENQTLATITFQNYFRMYEVLAGMTGTAETEAAEFSQIYKLDVVVIPTNRPMVRKDHPDIIYRTKIEKWRAVVEEIAQLNEVGQPVLVGTISIENSELLSKLLRKRKVPHVVLNAKYHEREAEIVAQAGRKGAVTIATNMAGRGTDILLGGNPEFLARKDVHPEEGQEKFDRKVEDFRELCSRERDDVLSIGGLHILGTERHESRRIDNQLRGRSGRQGDPGTSRFYLSLEDDLMRIFASDRVSSIMQKLGMKENIPIESKMVSRAIERAQKQVEMHNFDIRKHLLEYDDVMNKQREAIYTMRREILDGKMGKEYLLEVGRNILDYQVDQNCPKNIDPDDWTLDAIIREIRRYFGINLEEELETLKTLGIDELKEHLWSRVESSYNLRRETYGDEMLDNHERFIMLAVVDHQWKDHLLALDHLKEGIGMRAYGQRDPLVEYKRESFDIFQAMMDRIEDQIIQYGFQMEPVGMAEARAMRRAPSEVHYSQPEQPAPTVQRPQEPNRPQAVVETIRRAGPRVGRNDPCPCGSGKKYKHCCGVNA